MTLVLDENGEKTQLLKQLKYFYPDKVLHSKKILS